MLLIYIYWVMLFRFGERWVCLFVISMPRGIKTGLIFFLCCASDKHEVAIFCECCFARKMENLPIKKLPWKIKLNFFFFLLPQTNSQHPSIKRNKFLPMMPSYWQQNIYRSEVDGLMIFWICFASIATLCETGVDLYNKRQDTII